MDHNKCHKNNIEPNKDQYMSGPHHNNHHEGLLSRWMPHEGEREDQGEQLTIPLAIEAMESLCKVTSTLYQA